MVMSSPMIGSARQHDQEPQGGGQEERPPRMVLG
jgi:hypothetical protein